jgi:hypothetical protein
MQESRGPDGSDVERLSSLGGHLGSIRETWPHSHLRAITLRASVRPGAQGTPWPLVSALGSIAL